MYDSISRPHPIFPPSVGERKSIVDLFLKQVRLRPQQPAVIWRSESHTFEDLERRCAAIASILASGGVEADECVGIFSPRSSEMIAGVWGILLSGAAYLPLAVDYPDDRLRFMIEDAGVRIVLAASALVPRLKQLSPPQTIILQLESIFQYSPLPSKANTPSRRSRSVERASLAYVIYTSGSSGKPKGVMIEHGSILNQMLWLERAGHLDDTRVVLQKTPVSFDAAQWEILALSCGATVVMAADGSHRDPLELIGQIRRNGVTTLQCVPTLLAALLDTEGFALCTSLRQVFSGGEVLSSGLARRFRTSLPDCDLINLYGPTECTINASSHAIPRGRTLDGREAVPIGRPVDGVEFLILDGEMSRVPTGEVGELYIGGIQVARGYLGRPDLTAERFLDRAHPHLSRGGRLYRSGDLVRQLGDGSVEFIGRRDDQVKLRGHRIELDEVRRAVEDHNWVRHAAVILADDERTRSRSLVAFVELSPREAAVMDQGDHGAHHHSKRGRVQVRAQLANLGLREQRDIAARPATALPGRSPTAEHRRRAFARKTYRFYEGGRARLSDIVALLASADRAAAPRDVAPLVTVDLLGFVLRYLGQFHSHERLLPKYAYASPGALYATQLYVEVSGVAGLPSGYHYYHPVHHALTCLHAGVDADAPTTTFHFIGKWRAIETVYKQNIREVLEFETGHMLGLLDRVLGEQGLGIGRGYFDPALKKRLAAHEDDVYLGSFPLSSLADRAASTPVDVYVQPQGTGVSDLQSGQYEWLNGDLERRSDSLIEKKHVIAINQGVYERSQFGVTLVANDDDDWMNYISLGRKLQHLQMNDLGFGFMSSGYSSRTGHALGTARRMSDILSTIGREARASYFAIGGRVSGDQMLSEGMKEDAVHMRGPEELIKLDLSAALPAYMVPSRVSVLKEIPLLPNGKIDVRLLSEIASTDGRSSRAVVHPRTDPEVKVAEIWRDVLKLDDVSVTDDFFDVGGNSISAVVLVHRINSALAASLPVQTVFDAPTIEALARKVEHRTGGEASRLVRLSEGPGRPVFCWPGLGGYPLNLKSIAGAFDGERPVVGVQARGLNGGEKAHPSIDAMAADDIELIRQAQADGPYTLMGYSFGARIAFEAAHQLETMGCDVDRVILIAPGSPRIDHLLAAQTPGGPSAGRQGFEIVLLSVFTGRLVDPALDGFLEVADDDGAAAKFIERMFPQLDVDQIRRIIAVARTTFGFRYSPEEMTARRLGTPVTIIRARGDDRSFLEIEGAASRTRHRVIDMQADHYELLKGSSAEALARCLRDLIR